MPDFLYHLTTEESLKKILDERILRPGRFLGEVYFSDNLKDCIHLTGNDAGDRYIASQWDRMSNSKRFKLLVEHGLYKWEEITLSHPVLVIPIDWIGEVEKRQNIIGGVEYIHKGEIALPEEPEVIQAPTYTYKQAVPIGASK